MNVGLLSSASALGVVGYTGSVIFHGNLIALLTQLQKDKDFLAWMAATGILYYLSQQETIGGPVRLITGVAILAALLRVFSDGTASSLIADMQQGKISPAVAFVGVAQTAGIALGLNKSQGIDMFIPGAPLDSQRKGTTP